MPIKYQNGKCMLERLICISDFRPPFLSKMKELNQSILGKGLFAARKRKLCSTKGHLDNPKGP